MERLKQFRERTRQIWATAVAGTRGRAMAVAVGTRNLVQKTGARIITIFDKYDDILREGSYHAPKKSMIMEFFKKNKSKTAVETPMAILSEFGTSTWKTILNRLTFGSAIALAIKYNVLLEVGLGFLVFSGGLKYIGFRQAQKSRKEVLQERNFSGQLVEGTRSDLCRLYIAQKKIFNIMESFQPASNLTTAEIIDKIAETVTEERKRVKIIDGGRYGYGTEIYEFGEKMLKLANIRAPGQSTAATLPITRPLAGLSLKAAWDAGKVDEVIDQLAALQQALPAEAQAKLQQKTAVSSPAA